MKTFLTIVLVVAFGILNAQHQKSFYSRYAVKYDAIDLVDLDKYSVFNTRSFTSLKLIPENAERRLISLDEQALSPVNQGFIVNTNLISNLDPFLGTATTRNFEILNKDVRTTYIMDAMGNLRSSQMSISFGKKN